MVPPPTTRRSLADALALTPASTGSDCFEADSGGPPASRTFGGLLVGQALAAAHRTVAAGRPAHALHASFVRPGTTDEPLRYDVERTNDGARFATRRVVAQQAHGVVLVLSADFQADESGPEYEREERTHLPGPDGLAVGRYTTRWFESRDVDPDRPGAPAHARAAWFRARAPVGDDAPLHQHALAMLTDHGPTRAVRQPHLATLDVERRQSVSLDHSVWFHRPARVDGWLAYELVPIVTTGGRGFAIGTVRTPDGTLVASVAQEALLRIPD